jgi:hypothetical protein
MLHSGYYSVTVLRMYREIILQEIHTVQILHMYKGYHRVGLGQVRKVQQKQLTADSRGYKKKITNSVK